MKNKFLLTLTSSNSVETSLLVFGTWAQILKWQLGEEILANLNQMEGDGLLRNLIAVKAKLIPCGRWSVC